MVPRVESADDVREALTWMRFPPEGQRGIALGGRGQGFGQVGHADIGTLNDVVLGVFQIENAAAVADAEAIAALPGADVLFVGPADLSHALGVPGRFDDPIYLDAVRTVVGACNAHGKAAGHPHLRSRRHRPARRARVPLHRARLGPRVRGGRRPGHGRGRQRRRHLRTLDPSNHSSASRTAEAGARLAAGPVWASSTPATMRVPPTT